MKNQKKLNISLIIPTYNNEKTVISQITRCEKILQKYCQSYEIIIADDKSADKTPLLLIKQFKKKNHYKILLNKKNLGITNNIKQLYFLAKNEYILFYSADGDWDTKDVEHLIKTLIKNNAAIVIGKRIKKIGYTPYRHIVSFLHKLIPIVLFGVDTIDPGGIKIVKKQLAQIPLVSKSQFFEAEMIIRAKKKGYLVSWYPIIYKKMEYGSGSGGGFFSALDSVRDSLKLRFKI